MLFRSSLHQIPYGEKWSKNDVKKRIDFINKHNNSNNVNLKWNVVESIPVHNDIKLRHKNFRKFIDNYKDTILNVSKNSFTEANPLMGVSLIIMVASFKFD